MKAITITEKLIPFSHLPGTSLMIPYTTSVLQVYPQRLLIFSLEEKEPILLSEVKWDLEGGPWEQFIISLDIEKGRIYVSGKGSFGWLRYQIYRPIESNEIRLQIERIGVEEIPLVQQQNSCKLRRGEWRALVNNLPPLEIERSPIASLSLGYHKAHNWEQIKSRKNLFEILPFWFALGQIIPDIGQRNSPQGSLLNMERSFEALICRNLSELKEQLFRIVLGGFHHILVPRLFDEDFQGILPVCDQTIPGSPLPLLTEGCKLIQQLFIEEKGGIIHLLPALFPECESGRLVRLKLPSGVWNIEWRKGKIRRASLLSAKDQTLICSSPNTISCRMKSRTKTDKYTCGQPVFLQKEVLYFFDCFQ